MNPAAPVERITEARPWERAWWKPSAGNLGVLLYLAAIHSLALAGFILFPIPGWKVFLLALACAMAGGAGTTVCYHRYLAHRTLRMNPVLEQILIFFAVANGSGTPLSWAANHRAHPVILLEVIVPAF